MADGAARRAHRETTAVELAPTPVPELGRLVHQLVEGRENVIRELDLRDRRPPERCLPFHDIHIRD